MIKESNRHVNKHHTLHEVKLKPCFTLHAAEFRNNSTRKVKWGQTVNPPPTPTPLSSKKRKSLTAQNLTISAVHEKTFYEQIAKSPNLHLHVKVRSICIKYISVRGGGAGGAAAPPVGKKIVLFGQNWCTVRAKTR